jgi:hypothetical protein
MFWLAALVDLDIAAPINVKYPPPFKPTVMITFKPINALWYTTNAPPIISPR